MQYGWNALESAAILYAPRLAMSLAVLVAFWLGALAADAVIGRLGARAHLSADLTMLGRRVAKAALIIVGIITALGTIGVDVSALVAGLGLTGFALGFALKDVLSNVLAGALILLYRPFHRNDRVAVAGFSGRVTDIDLRYTTLDTDDRRILIPNSTLFTNAISVEKPEA
jgi:small conductance mechanosensitive channel